MSDAILETLPLGFVWPTLDPFLFCVHHDDDYPPGDAQLGVDANELRGRALGSDFELRDGFRMYHGQVVPGFPRHPHRGFETVTLVRHGRIDHSDSLGARARFGGGDAQWMTAGRGIVHAEMFPLLSRQQRNRCELFQLWLNLPRDDKMVDPHFTMLWSEAIPRRIFRLDGSRSSGGSGGFGDCDEPACTVTLIAGAYEDAAAPAPPPNSWAARAEARLTIWTLAFEPGARFTVPASAPETNRMLYLFAGDTVSVDGETVELGATGVALRLAGDAQISLENGGAPAEALLLGAVPIGEPVVQQGPFVMNTPGEIRQAMIDYHETGFGGWPWRRDDPVHGPDRGRFAEHPDGRLDEPSS
jgi:redox-sensitive bicupin YhaK (pirin superfamily)